MATEQEKADLRAIQVSGVARHRVSPDGTTDTEFRSLTELRGIRADLDAEELVTNGRRAPRSFVLGTSKGIGG